MNKSGELIDRRNFLGGALAAGTIIVGASCGFEDENRTVSNSTFSQPPQTDNWNEIRNQFNLTPDFINLSALLIASHPKPVREAIEHYRRELDENPAIFLQNETNQRESGVLQAAARYLGADSADIALTDSTTMGLGLVYNGIHIGAGQEFLTTEQNYYSTDESLRLKAERSGASVRRISLYEKIETVSEDEITGNLINSISAATRVIALTWVHSSTGLKLPIRKIADEIKEINASRVESEQILLCVDGIHGFGIEDVEMSDLGCDFFIAGCHKWLFGPRGTGIIWGSSRGWENVSPTIPTFMDDSVRSVWITGDEPSGKTTGRRMSPGGFKAFEHQWAMKEAFDFLMQTGKTKIADRTNELNRRLKEGLAAIPNVKLYTPMSENLSAGIVCFDIEGISARNIVNQLREKKIVASVTPYATLYARLTPSIYNSIEEIETTLREIKALA